MNEIYVVTEGSYSDYGIVCVCADRALADRIVELRNRGSYLVDDAMVEVYEVVEDIARTGLRKMYHAKVDREGRVIEKRLSEKFEWDLGEPPHIDGDAYPQYDGSVSAWSYRSLDVAVKAARDKLAELKARQEGVG